MANPRIFNYLSKFVLKNGIEILLSKIAVPISFFILTMLVARGLGPAEFGKYSILLSFYVIFLTISVLGLDNFIIKEVSRDVSKAGLFLSQGTVVGMGSTTVCFSLMMAIAYVMHYDPLLIKRFYLLGIILFPAFLNLLSEMIFVAVQKPKYAFYVSVVREIILIILSVWWLSLGFGIDGVMLAIFCSRILGIGFFLWSFAQCHIQWDLRINMSFLKFFLGSIPVFMFINIFSIVLQEIDILILSKIINVSQLGIYSVAKKLVRFSFIITFSVVTAMFPVISDAFLKNKKEFLEYFKKFGKGILGCSLLVTVFVVFLSGFVVQIFFGLKYAESIHLLQILGWILVPLSLSFFLSRFLIVSDHQNKDLLALGISLVIFIVIGILGAIYWGSLGMVYANLFAISMLTGIQYYLTQRHVLRPLTIHLKEKNEAVRCHPKP